MYNCVDCGREHASHRRSDGESLCEACATKSYVPCVKCGKFVDPDYINNNNKCDQCNLE